MKSGLGHEEGAGGLQKVNGHSVPQSYMEEMDCNHDCDSCDQLFHDEDSEQAAATSAAALLAMRRNVKNIRSRLQKISFKPSFLDILPGSELLRRRRRRSRQQQREERCSKSGAGFLEQQPPNSPQPSTQPTLFNIADLPADEDLDSISSQTMNVVNELMQRRHREDKCLAYSIEFYQKSFYPGLHCGRCSSCLMKRFFS